MKHIKGDFSLNAWVRSPRVDLRGGTEAKTSIIFFEYGHVVYQIKADEACSNSNIEGKDQESIQSSTTPDAGYQWKSNKLTIRHHKPEPIGQPFPSR